MKRCDWANSTPIETKYHDEEWGVPIHDDRLLFEMLILEGAQAGLNWITVLKKRSEYKNCFDNFNAKVIAEYDEIKINNLLLNNGIIRSRKKIDAAIVNAKIFLKIQNEFGSFDSYIWGFVDGVQINNVWNDLSEIPIKSVQSDAMSKDLKKIGFKFVGPSICYAYMQAVGMVNDHLTSCYRYLEIKNSKNI